MGLCFPLFGRPSRHLQLVADLDYRVRGNVWRGVELVSKPLAVEFASKHFPWCERSCDCFLRRDCRDSELRRLDVGAAMVVLVDADVATRSVARRGLARAIAA